MDTIASDLASTYRRDGAVHIPRALDQATLKAALACYEWSLAHPSPSACHFYESEPGNFYQDLCHPEAAFEYRELLESSAIPDIVGQLWGSSDVWFLYEQIFLKDGGETRRTPWHQDTPYLALDGSEVAVVWINFDRTEACYSLEFVRGSHLGTLYNGSAFDPSDDTQPIYAAAGLPRLPDIEADRSRWDIQSWATEPGDIIVFHPSILHGGAPVAGGARRRTLSLRFFGADARYAMRPQRAPAPLTAGLHDVLKDGQPFRHAAFPRLRPQPSGFENIPAAAGHAISLRAQIQKQ